VDALILTTPKWDMDFHVHIDVSNLVIRVMLIQNRIGKCNQPITYASHLLNNTKRNYTTMEHEVLAMVYPTQVLTLPFG